MLDQSIVQRIYESLFRKIKRTEINLFLCGGASTKKKKSYRDILRDEIRSIKNVSIYYPEDLFSEILARKKTDLLTLEKVLAANSDIIIIICESPGSFTELGAFVNNSDTCEKVVAFIQSKYKNDKSFINQGPLEYLKKHSARKTKVVYFNSDRASMAREAKSVLRETSVELGRCNARYNLGQISGQECFIMLLLYFYESIFYVDLREVVTDKYMTVIKNVEKIDEKDSSLKFETLYNAAKKRLYKKGYLINRKDLGCYQLSRDGYLNVKRLINEIALVKDDEVDTVGNTNITTFTRFSIHEKRSDILKSARDKFSYVDGIRLDSLRKSFYRHG